MKKALLVIAILFAGVAQAQYVKMTAAGYEYKRNKTDSAILIPTFCGVPTLRGSGVINQGALAIDSCNHRFYFYDPKTSAWDTIKGGGGGILTTLQQAILNGALLTKNNIIRGGDYDFIIDSTKTFLINQYGASGRTNLSLSNNLSGIKYIKNYGLVNEIRLDKDSVQMAVNDTGSKRFITVTRDKIRLNVSPAFGDSSKQIATTEWVKSNGGGGSTYTANSPVIITGNVVSVDTSKQVGKLATFSDLKRDSLALAGQMLKKSIFTGGTFDSTTRLILKNKTINLVDTALTGTKAVNISLNKNGVVFNSHNNASDSVSNISIGPNGLLINSYDPRYSVYETHNLQAQSVSYNDVILGNRLVSSQIVSTGVNPSITQQIQTQDITYRTVISLDSSGVSLGQLGNSGAGSESFKINGRTNKIRGIGYKNNAGLDSVLSTNTNGDFILKYISPSTLATASAPISITGNVISADTSKSSGRLATYSDNEKNTLQKITERGAITDQKTTFEDTLRVGNGIDFYDPTNSNYGNYLNFIDGGYYFGDYYNNSGAPERFFTLERGSMYMRHYQTNAGSTQLYFPLSENKTNSINIPDSSGTLALRIKQSGIFYNPDTFGTITLPPASGGTNIYNTNGTLTGQRRVNGNGYLLKFDSSKISIRDTTTTTGHLYDFNNGFSAIDYEPTNASSINSNSLSGVKISTNDRNNLDTSNNIWVKTDRVEINSTTQIVINGKTVFPSTITTVGTTSTQTINKNTGQVNVASAATSVQVNNSMVTTSSIVTANLIGNDSTADIRSIVKANGSFTIYFNTPPTNEVALNFWVTN